MNQDSYMESSVMRVGGSLYARIPKKMAKARSIKAGDNIKINVVKPFDEVFGCMKGIGPWTPELKEWLRGRDLDH